MRIKHAAGITLLIIILTGFFTLYAYARDQLKFRTAKRTEISGKGWVTLPDGTRCHDREEDVIEITFPVNGGEIQGKRHWWGHESETDAKNQWYCKEKNETQTIVGTFSGGDGGKIEGWVINDNPNRKRRFKLTGVVHADGKLYIGWSKYHVKKPKELVFTPFCTEETDLNVYTEKAQDIINGNMLNAASTLAYEGFRRGVEEGWQYLVQEAHTMEMLKGTYVWRNSLGFAKKPPLSMMEELSLKFIPDRKKVVKVPATPLLKGLFENLGTAISLIEAADSALDGDYATAAFQTVVEGIGLYSNSLGLMLAVGQAVKADWDAFAKRYYAKEYRHFYEELYYTGGKRPSMTVWKKNRKQRLLTFMEEARDTLTDGGVGGAGSWSTGGTRASRFRAMLIDFAEYRMELKLTYDDFATVEDSNGNLVFKHKYLQSLFITLFNDFEKIYINDAVAHAMRQIALKQARLLEDESQKARALLENAESYQFAEVWEDDAELELAYCKAVSEMKKEMNSKHIFKD